MHHKTAEIAPGATIGKDVEIGPFCLVEAGVVLGDRCRLESHVVVRRGSVIGAGVRIHPFAVIGDLPQDLKFDPELESGVLIGADSVLREGVTINRSTRPGHRTVVGQKSYLMANSHLGHDCVVGDRCVLANNVLLAGFVEVGDDTFLGGGAGVHQFTRIGRGAMISGLCALTRDAPPFCTLAERDRLVGLNLIGCRRRQMERAHIALLKQLLQEYGRAPRKFREEAAARIEAEGWAEDHPAAIFLSFFADSQRGIVPFRKGVHRGENGGE